MRTLVVYGIALVACLLLLTPAQAQCYINPITGQQVCPTAPRTPIRTIIASAVPNSWEASPAPVRAAIAASVPNSWEMPVQVVQSEVSWELPVCEICGKPLGYSISNSSSGGSTGGYTAKSYGSAGIQTVVRSGGSTGFAVQQSYGSSGSVVQYSSPQVVVQSYGSTGSVVQSAPAPVIQYSTADSSAYGSGYGSTGSYSAGSAGSSVRSGPVRRALQAIPAGPVRRAIQNRRAANQVGTYNSYVSADSFAPYDSGADSSATQYAAVLNNRRGLRHDRSYNGAEVVYRSSGTATQEMAVASWMNSPEHRNLLESGAITSIACVGNVCVGR